MIINKDLIIENKGYSLGGLCDNFIGLKGTVLWENTGSFTNFTGQDINISSLANFLYIEIVYWTETVVPNWSYLETTGKIPISAGHQYFIGGYVPTSAYDGAPQWFGRNYIISNDKKKITFGSGCNRDNNGWNTRNSAAVPLFIVGYNAY